MVKGNKVRQQVKVPNWICDSMEYSMACLRGLFDTDGSFYIDRHKHKGKLYKSAGICFTNFSKPVLNFFADTLDNLNYHPTRSSSNHVVLRRQLEIKRFFSEIKPANDKHLKKFKNFYK